MAWIPFRLKMTILSTLPMGLHTVYRTSWTTKGNKEIQHNLKVSNFLVSLALHEEQPQATVQYQITIRQKSNSMLIHLQVFFRDLVDSKLDKYGTKRNSDIVTLQSIKNFTTRTDDNAIMLCYSNLVLCHYLLTDTKKHIFFPLLTQNHCVKQEIAKLRFPKNIFCKAFLNHSSSLPQIC